MCDNPSVSDLSELLTAALGDAGLLQLFLQLSLQQHQLLLQLRHNKQTNKHQTSADSLISLKTEEESEDGPAACFLSPSSWKRLRLPAASADPGPADTNMTSRHPLDGLMTLGSFVVSSETQRDNDRPAFVYIYEPEP